MCDSLFSMQHTWHRSAASSRLPSWLAHVHTSRLYFSQIEPEQAWWKRAVSGNTLSIYEHTHVTCVEKIPNHKIKKNTHTPLRQTCVFEWQAVKFSLGSEVGHCAVAPLQKPSRAHSDESLHCSPVPLKPQVAVQQGPWLGLQKKNYTTKI